MKAVYRFERILRTFIEGYLDKYPDIDDIRERQKIGEHIFVKNDTLEISVKLEKDMTLAKYERFRSERFEGYHCIDVLFCTKDGGRNQKRYVDTRDTDDYSYGCVQSYIDIHNIKNVEELPEFLRQTPEEIAEEEERKRKWKEEKERERLEKERVRAEHALGKDDTVLALIIPDVHGRTFWKDAVAKFPDVPVIFLGDYLDPYQNYIENIKAKDALPNFKEILEYRKKEGARVTLLLGNHDLHYFTADFDCSRKDERNADEIRALFESGMSLFSIAGYLETDGPAAVYSHAGIVPGWVSMRFPDVDASDFKSVTGILNSRLHDMASSSDFIHTLITDAPYQRGGGSKYGSPVWADLSEFKDAAPQEGIYQIFGHTQQEEDPVYGNGYCCLDCRRAFLLTKTGKTAEIGE